MALKMRDDRNGRNNKRRKDGSVRPQSAQDEVTEQHVNGDWNEGLLNFTSHAGRGPDNLYVSHSMMSNMNEDHKRMNHNEVEKRRKDRIKQGIANLGLLLPPMSSVEILANANSAERSTFAILEKTAEYIRELKDKNDRLLMDKGQEVQAEEIRRLKAELEEVNADRDKYEQQLKAAGIPLVDDFAVTWTFRKFDADNVTCTDDSIVLNLPSGDNQSLKVEDTTKSKKGGKSRRKNTISVQLENVEKAKSCADQGLKTDSNEMTMTDMDQGMIPTANLGMMGVGQNMQNAAMNPQIFNASVLGGNMQQGPGQLLLPAMNILNHPGMNAGAINPSAMNPANFNPALMQSLGMDRCNGMVPYMSPNGNLSALTQNNAADGFGLLQMAMRDAGITATSMSASGVPVSAHATNATTLAPTLQTKPSGNSELTTPDASSSPLHTLASVAADSQSSTASNAASSSTLTGITQAQTLNGTASTSTTQAFNLNMPIMTPGQCGIMQTFNPNLGLQMMAQNQGMPYNMMQNGGLGGITMMPQQQGQIIYLNEQGIPVISNMPMQGLDGSTMTNPQMAVAGLKPGCVPVTGMSQVVTDQKGQNVLPHLQDSASADTQRDGMTQFQSNLLQSQSQVGDMNNQQQCQTQKVGINPLHNQTGINMFGNAGDNTSALLQVQQQQQQFNQQLLQAAQLSGLAPGINRSGHGLPPSVNALQGKSENANNSSAIPGENLMLPVSQSGNLLTLSHGQQPMQLPSALILPNGQIIPVVTQPQLLMGQNQQPTASVVNAGTPAVQQNVSFNKPSDNTTNLLQGCELEKDCAPQISEGCSVSTAQTATTRQTGLLMTTNTIVTAPNRPVSTSTAALTTTVVPTTVTGSIMTTQVQKHQTMTTQVQQRQMGNGTPNLPPQKPVSGTVTTSGNTSAIPSSVTQMPANIEQTNLLPGSSPMTILPNGQFVNNNGAIVLTLPTTTPGQPPTSVLVDPNTMQVLGMLPPQQQPQQQQQNNLPAPPVPSGQQPQAKVQTAGEQTKKSKKGSHRALKPKPPTVKDKTSKAQTSAASNTTDSVSIPAAISTGQQNNEDASPGTSQANNTANTNVDISATDILAQAAESIFSDISPSISNFYNPANEDNPLHIDTSAGDTEEDAVTVSPKKDRLQNSQAIYNKQSSVSYHDKIDPDTSPYHFVESPPPCKELSKKSKSKKNSGSGGSQKNGGVKRSSKKPSASSKNSKKSQQQKEKIENPPKTNDAKTGAKLKAVAEKESTLDEPPKILETMDILRSTEHGKDDTPKETLHTEQVPQPTEYQQLFSDESSHGEFAQQETPVDIPETISFTENELSDVLDQVEKLGNSFSEESTPTPPNKKSKSRKTKGQSESGSEYHSSKKKKKTSHDEPDLASTSLSMDSILASISGAANQTRNLKDVSPKKGQEEINTLSIHVEEPTLHMPTLTSPTTSAKSVSPSSSKKNKTGSELSAVSNNLDTNFKKTVQMENMNNTLHIVSSPPQSTASVADVNKTLGSCNTSPTSNVNSMHSVTGQKTSNMRHGDESRLISNDTNITEFPSFFMSDNSDSHQVSPGPQSLPCLPTSRVSMTLSGPCPPQLSSSSAISTPACKLPSDQQRLSSSSSLPNVQSSMMSPNARSMCSSSSPIATSVQHGPQSLPSSINNQLTYSAESLFSPSSNCPQLNALPDIRGELNQSSNPPAPPLMHPSSQVNTHSQNTSPGVSRPRTSIFSAENFVQPSMNCDSQSVPKSSYNRAQEDFRQTTSSRANQIGLGAESFNFSNIASNVPSNNRGRSTSNVNTTMTPPTSSSFSFSLGGNTESTNNSFPSHIGHHHFPFYPLHPSVSTSQSTSTESTPETSRKSGQLDHQPVGFPPFASDQRSTSFQSSQLTTEQNHLNHMSQVPQPFSSFNPGSESSGTSQTDDNMFPNQPQLGVSSSGNKTDSRSVSGSSNVRKQKDQGHGRTPMPGTEQQDSRNMERSLFVSTGLPSFYTPIRQQSNGPPPLETPPLHHLPQSSNDTRMSNTYQSNMPNSSHQFNSEFSNVRLEGSSVQMPNGGNQNYNQHQQTSQSVEANKHNRPKAKPIIDHHMSRRQGMMPMDSQATSRGNTSRQPPQQQHDHRSSQNPGSHTPTSNTHLEQQQAPAPPQNRPQKASSKQSKGQLTRSKKSSKQSFNQELDSTVPHSLFDPSQGIPPYFPIANLSPPPSRGAQPDGPTYMPHLFGPSRSLPNANIGVHKNPAELGGTFNPLFPPVRTQTSLGLNFQPGFGMNPVHGGHGSAAQLKSHSSGVSVTQPMSNFNLTNIFSDVNTCAQSNGGLNISPIKFPHANAIIPPQPGMDHNSLQHHHQPGMLYHNRTPGPPPVLHNAMSINSLIGHNHPGMGQINNTMGQTFHGYGHPSSFTMPHLNFTMHDH